jgi:hypothetical protein
VKRFGKQLAEQALNPDGPSFAEGLRRARERRDGNGARPPGGSDKAPL